MPVPTQSYPIALTYPVDGQTVSGGGGGDGDDPADAGRGGIVPDCGWGVPEQLPCGQRAIRAYPLDTSQLAAGLHTIQVWAHDTNNDVLLSNAVTVSVTR